jgi:hypothetical protein
VRARPQPFERDHPDAAEHRSGLLQPSQRQLAIVGTFMPLTL